jgi:hypothetical protein
VTVDAVVKPAPVIVTDVFPANGPDDGTTFDTVGGGRYVYVAAADATFVPPTVETAMFTVPAEPGGTATLIAVDVSDATVAAASLPNSTSVAFARLVPLIVTMPPPDNGPADGLIAVTTGGAT